MTDKERFDFLEKHKNGYGNGWVCRESTTGRGLRIHETSNINLHTIRDAIDYYILSKKGK